MFFFLFLSWDQLFSSYSSQHCVLYSFIFIFFITHVPISFSQNARNNVKWSFFYFLLILPLLFLLLSSVVLCSSFFLQFLLVVVLKHNFSLL
jgi:hypothetical protein